MSNQKYLKQTVKMFKIGNSYAFRILKKDRELLDADMGTDFEKIVSSDGKKITFKKIEKKQSNTLEKASKLYDGHSDLMKRLENM